MKKQNAIKALIASLLVTVALGAPAVFLSRSLPEPSATLAFTGASLRYVNGGYQMLFDVTIEGEKLYNSSGAEFFLKYNQDYLTPSDSTDNSTLTEGATDAFFQVESGLFLGADGKEYNPFRTDTDYCKINPNGQLYLNLKLDQRTNGVIAQHIGATESTTDKVGILENVTDKDEAVRYVFNLCQPEENVNDGKIDPEEGAEPITLGQISFRVKEEKLPEIYRYFENLDTAKCYNSAMTAHKAGEPVVDVYQVDGKTLAKREFLLNIDRSMKVITYADNQEQPWVIATFEGEVFNMSERNYGPNLGSFGTNGPEQGQVADRYEFHFAGKTPVAVTVTEPDFTINAYQNFTSGTAEDLELSLGRYSPTVTVTYADGSRENLAFPWGKSGTGYAVTVRDKASGSREDITDYDPTASVNATEYLHSTGAFTGGETGTDYFFTQNFTLSYVDETGAKRSFTAPVTAHMKVTPIKVIDVTADDLEKTYTLSAAARNITSPEALELPQQARIITDVVAGDVALVTDIQGWMPDQSADKGTTASTWPGVDTTSYDATTLMHSLKGDGYDGTKPYWPEETDPLTDAAMHVGTYSFVTSDSTHTNKRNIQGSDIQADYPWLTVEEEYAIQGCTRKIVSLTAEQDKLYNASYAVSYISTKTETSDTPGGNGAVGQPTLTLQVKKSGASGAESLNEASVFRVWLPNGLELGTGQNAGGVTVDGWFSRNTNGYYSAKKLVDESHENYFYLETNPAEPNASAVGDCHSSRETLRRYINLGGWFYVSVCENPTDTTPIWSERLPVYVPPRENVYTEDKVYNFIAQNADLMSWPGGVGDTLYLPHGEYETVSATGLPEYDTLQDITGSSGSGTITAGTKVDGTTSGSIFVDGNPLDPDWSKVKTHSESYGVTTLYDGQTGAQPGLVYNIKADTKDSTGNAWKTPTAEGKTSSVFTNPQRDILRYGPTKLYEGETFTRNGVTYKISGFTIPGYGTVFNPDTHKVTLRRDKAPYNPAEPDEPNAEKPAQSEKIKLLSVVDNGITRRDSESISSSETYKDRNVALVTFDTQQEGYTVRQSYTLTIKNVGTTDIYGLDINSTLDGYPTEAEGGRFVVTKPPASFLPAGETTTFELTYVYNLQFDTSNKEETTYHDILFITSNSHNDPVFGGVNGGGSPAAGSAYPTGDKAENYLLEFEAEFKVTQKPLHRVEVIYRPHTGNMGTANLIVGETGSTAAPTMNYTTTTRTYVHGSKVYVVANLVDEYEVKKVTMTRDGDGSSVSYHEYGTDLTTYPEETAKLDDNTIVYVFEMPDDDVTVVVDFYEPVWSKLRLEKIFDFSDKDGNDLVSADSEVHDDPTTAETDKKPGGTNHVYKVWRKTFSEAEETAAGGYTDENTQDLYRMTVGSPMYPESEATDFKPSENQYIVIIPYDADMSQVQATLRRVVYHEDWQLTGPTAEDVAPSSDYPYGYNEELEDVTITMELYNTYYPDGSVADTLSGSGLNSDEVIYTPSANTAGYGPRPAFTGKNNATVTGVTGTFPPQDYTASGTSATSSSHASAVFDSPAQGASKYVRIKLEAKESQDDGTEKQVTRYYYVEIHRATESPSVTMYYGNSPYGMIMNNRAWYGNDSARTEAKAAFDQGMTFDGLDNSKVPEVVQTVANGLQGVTYWREAWVYNTGLYEPETYTNTKETLNTSTQPSYGSGNTPTSYAQVDTDPKDAMYSIYHDTDYRDKVKYTMHYNLDKDDYAYFAILGEDFMEPGILEARDSSGRKVELDKIVAKATVKLLDITGTSQVERFADDADTVEVTLDLGVAGRKLADASGGVATLGANCWPVRSADTDGDGAADSYTLVENIRPGRYLIEYTFPDYNGVDTLTVYRPLVILSKVGDVNADLKRNSGSDKAGSDEYQIEDRVTDPLGYAAGKWDSATGKETGYPAANLFKFRVCDVNNDRNVNNIDANTVYKAAKDEQAGNNTWLRFYHPTNYGRPDVGKGYTTTTTP